MVQNFFMYVDLVLCNFVVFWYNGILFDVFIGESLVFIVRGKVLVIIFNNVGIGIIIVLFLKQLNFIFKIFVSVLEIMFIVVLCWIIFGILVDIFTFVVIVIVFYVVIFYVYNFVDNIFKFVEGNQKLNISVQKLIFF